MKIVLNLFFRREKKKVESRHLINIDKKNE